MRHPTSPPSRWIAALASAVLSLGCASSEGDAPREDVVADTHHDPDSEATDTRASDTAGAADGADTHFPTADADTADDAAAPEVLSLACDDGGDCLSACGEGRCDEAGRCRFEQLTEGCVIVDEAAHTGTCVPAMASAPGASCRFCNPAWDSEGYTQVALGVDFETGLAPLEADNLSGSDAAWAATSRRASGGLRSAYFGDGPRATYDVGDRAWGILTTPTVTLPHGTPLRLSFDLWLETEETPGFDVLRVYAAHGDDPPAELWTSDAWGGTSYGVFLPLAIEAGESRGEPVRFILEFDTVDAKINNFEGAYIDRLRVATGCCAEDAGCLATDPCAAARCDDGRCVAEPIEGCCLTARDCDDGDACTEDACAAPGGACTHTPIAACCAADGDCDDGDACTADRCDQETRRCHHQPLCCGGDADCDDGDTCTLGRCDGGECRYVHSCCDADDACDDHDACTIDRCDDDGVCAHTFDHRPGCCRFDVMTQRFDGAPSPPPGWSADGPSNNVGWHVHVTDEAQSGERVLYYGHPSLGWYQSGGPNAGEVLSAPIEVPHGVDARLAMRLLLDVEAAPDRDLFTVSAAVAGARIPLLDKASVTLGAWQDVDVDVSFLAGQVIRLVWRFDTVDAQGNGGLGVMIDDVRVASSCQARPCASDAACPSPVACVTGACDDDGGCVYAQTCGRGR